MRSPRAGRLVAQQSPLDAFCGIYVLLNFLASHVRLKIREYYDVDEGGAPYTTHAESAERKIFRELMHSAEEAGHLCAETVTHGFAKARLKDTFDTFLKRNGLRGASDIAEQATKDLFDFAQAYFSAASRGERRGIGVLTVDQSHWVLIAGASDRGLLIMDSADTKRSYQLTRRMNNARGLARQLDPETLLLLSVYPAKNLLSGT